MIRRDDGGLRVLFWTPFHPAGDHLDAEHYIVDGEALPGSPHGFQYPLNCGHMTLPPCAQHVHAHTLDAVMFLERLGQHTSKTCVKAFSVASVTFHSETSLEAPICCIFSSALLWPLHSLLQFMLSLIGAHQAGRGLQRLLKVWDRFDHQVALCSGFA